MESSSLPAVPAVLPAVPLTSPVEGSIAPVSTAAVPISLPGANVSADYGLSSLGLVMQLGGTLFAAYSAVLAILGIALMRHSVLGGAAGAKSATLWMLVILSLSVMRAMFHRAAGTQLLYGVRDETGESSNAFGGIRYYIVVGIAHSLVIGLLVKFKLGGDAKLASTIAVGLLVWPATLAVIISLPRFRRCAHRLPIGEDKGFEGAAILMTVLGLCGALATCTLLIASLKQSDTFLSQGPGVLVLLALVMLAIRSVIHVQAGVSGLRETSVDRSVGLASRYANFGVISSFSAAGALLLLFMSAELDVFNLALVAGGCWMLLAWPLIVRRFFSERQFADLMAGDAADLHRRAPDAGLSGLGWFLIAQAALGASFLIPQFALRDGSDHPEVTELATLFGGGGVQSIWWSVGLVMLQVWAGMELVKMSPHHRVISNIYGVVSSALAVWLAWPVLALVTNASRELIADEKLLLSIGPLVMQLVVPIATLALVNRKITPTARATYRRAR